MAIPAVTREYTPGSCHNSRNPMTHTPRREMTLSFPALGAEQSIVPNQTGKEPQFSSQGTRESRRTLSQEEMNSDVNSGMQNRSVYPNSTQDETHFPLICFLAIPCSTAYSTSGLTSLRNRKRFPETPVSSRYEY